MHPSPSAETTRPCDPSGRDSIMGNPHLELPAPGRRPALDDDLLFGIEIDGIAALRVQIAEEAVLPAGEREIRHRRGDADVDPDVAGTNLVAELARGGAAGREQARHVPVRGSIDHGD